MVAEGLGQEGSERALKLAGWQEKAGIAWATLELPRRSATSEAAGPGVEQSLRFVHAADLHLDSPMKAAVRGMPAHLETAVRDATLTTLERLVQLCLDQAVDFLIVAGDLFDQADHGLRASVHWQRAWARLAAAGIPVLVVWGNHDQPSSFRPATRAEGVGAGGAIFPRGKPALVQLVRPGAGVVAEVWGISYPTRAVSHDYAQRLIQVRTSVPRSLAAGRGAELGSTVATTVVPPLTIAVLHTQVGTAGSSMAAGSPEDPLAVLATGSPAGSAAGVPAGSTVGSAAAVATRVTGRSASGSAAGSTYAPSRLDSLVQSGVDYWALGHVHQREVLHWPHPLVVYPGNPQGRDVQESGLRGVYLVEATPPTPGAANSGWQLRARFQPLQAVVWERADVEVSQCSQGEQVVAAVQAAAERVRQITQQQWAEVAAGGVRGPEGIIVRFCLQGRTALYSELLQPGFVEEVLQTVRDVLLTEGDSGSVAPWVWAEGLDVAVRPPLDVQALQREGSFVGDLARLAEQVRKALEAGLALPDGVTQAETAVAGEHPAGEGGSPAGEAAWVWQQLQLLRSHMGLARLVAGWDSHTLAELMESAELLAVDRLRRGEGER